MSCPANPTVKTGPIIGIALSSFLTIAQPTRPFDCLRHGFSLKLTLQVAPLEKYMLAFPRFHIAGHNSTRCASKSAF